MGYGTLYLMLVLTKAGTHPIFKTYRVDLLRQTALSCVTLRPHSPNGE